MVDWDNHLSGRSTHTIPPSILRQVPTVLELGPGLGLQGRHTLSPSIHDAQRLCRATTTYIFLRLERVQTAPTLTVCDTKVAHKRNAPRWHSPHGQRERVAVLAAVSRQKSLMWLVKLGWVVLHCPLGSAGLISLSLSLFSLRLTIIVHHPSPSRFVRTCEKDEWVCLVHSPLSAWAESLS